MTLISWELRPGSRHFKHYAMRISYRIKSADMLLLSLVATPYTVLTFMGIVDPGAILEWTLAVLFIPYLLSLGIDIIHELRWAEATAIVEDRDVLSDKVVSEKV
jgi:hypothetical protein